MIVKISFYLLCALLLLLPFHAFFVTWFSHIFLQSSSNFLSQYSAIIASWKEVLIVVLGLFFCFKWIKNKSFPIRFLIFDYFFVAFFLIAILSGFLFTQDISQIIWGLKYDFEFWILFYLIRGLVFNESQMKKLYNIFFISASSVVIIGLILYFFLPQDTLQYFGYSTHVSSFNTEKPLPMFHTVGESETARAASTFSGPNQFGFYLIIFISFLLLKIRGNVTLSLSKGRHGILLFIACSLLIITLLSLFLTFSRSAWLGVLTIFSLFIFISLSKKSRWKFVGMSFFSGMILIFITTQLFSSFSKDILFRSTSSSLHFEKSTQALDQVLKYPFGTGLGTAGPAALRSESLQTVYLPTSKVEELLLDGLTIKQRNEIWLYDRVPGELVAFKPKNIEELEAITVFQDIKNNHPELFQKVMDSWDAYYIERIAENWHIQMFQEFGWIGGIFYILFLIFLLRHFYRLSVNNNHLTYTPLGFLTLSGFMVAGMFLHVFEDASSSLTLGILLGLCFQSAHRKTQERPM